MEPRLGGIAGALVGMGIPEYEAKRYEGKIKAGNVLLSVHTETSHEVSTAKRIFEECGAEDVATAGEASVSEPKEETRDRTKDYDTFAKSGRD